jgi:2-oxoglutarate ferredoxin oxidoreductase subunit alpha
VSNEGVLSGSFFMDGDTACAEGAISAGCRFFAGYPITPATEVAERMARRLPQVEGTYIQMEDEIASIAAVLGASWAGKRAMTATSGPGFSLMMENLGLAVMTETPCVIANVQRAGPSTGMPTLVGQGDIMQARWGSHGPYEIIALAPSSPQELFDVTLRAFNLAEQYRTPVLVMTDESVGHMTERVVIPGPDEVPMYPRRKPKSPPGNGYLAFEPGPDGIPDMACAGEGYRIHVTGLTHDERGYPDTISVETQQQLVSRLMAKIRDNADDIIDIREDGIEDAEVIVVSYGISARTAARPIRIAREQGMKVGMLRLVTIWPFPERRIQELASKVKAFVVPEINMGQVALEVERCACGRARTVLVPHAGGGLHDPEVVLEAIKGAAR